MRAFLDHKVNPLGVEHGSIDAATSRNDQDIRPFSRSSGGGGKQLQAAVCANSFQRGRDQIDCPAWRASQYFVGACYIELNHVWNDDDVHMHLPILHIYLRGVQCREDYIKPIGAKRDVTFTVSYVA